MVFEIVLFKSIFERTLNIPVRARFTSLHEMDVIHKKKKLKVNWHEAWFVLL